MNKRAIATGAAVGVAAIGAAFMGWATVDYIIHAPILTQFLLSAGATLGLGTAGYASLKRE